MSIEKVYSVDGEIFRNKESLINCELSDFEKGAEVQIYEGDKVEWTHSNFISSDDILEIMNDRSYDELGEFNDMYLDDITPDLSKNLHELVLNFFNKNIKQPTGFTVENMRKIDITVGDF